MARPKLENGFLRLSNELAEALMRTPLNGSQLRILLCVIRECYGRNGGQKAASLSLRRIAAMTNIDLRRVRREVTNLLAARLICRRQPSGSQALYGLCKDYDSWQVEKRECVRGGEFAHGGQLALGVNSPTGEGVNSPPQEGVNSPTQRRKKKSLKKERAKEPHAADSRFQPIVDHYLRRTKELTEAKAWDQADGKNLRELLGRNPEIPDTGIIRWLDNAFNSTDPYPLRRGFRMTEFCRHFSKYTQGPLFKGGGNGSKGNGHGGPTLTLGELERMREAKASEAAARATT